VRHAHELVTLERSLHVFVEGDVQDAAHAVPGLIELLGISYLTLHLAGTVGVLLWLHQRRPAAFPRIRTTLVLASGLALLLDALNGAVVTGLAAGAALLIAGPTTNARLTRLAERPPPARAPDELAA
jgi:hypothetical protein